MNAVTRASSIAFLIFTIHAHASRNAGDLEAEYFFDQTQTSALTPAPNPPPAPSIDWSQPPLGCVEEMVPHPAPRPCLDLTQVANPLKDWPPNISQADHDYWFGQRRGLLYCRSLELLRREAAQPGSQSPGAIESSWMATDAVRDYGTKVDAIYEASDRYQVPAHVLTGAVYQESMFSTLGISDDGGNYSCGMEQINLIGWCNWANAQSSKQRAAMGWPKSRPDCNDTNLVDLNFIKPFYDIAKTRLAGLPEYRLQKVHFQNIALADVAPKWPQADSSTNDLRYQMVTSFINNCSDPRLGVLAKASELKSIYNAYLSPAFKSKDRYSGSTRFQRQCKKPARDNAYPLHTGWLMAVASYNAGPRAIDAVTYFNQWDDNGFNDPATIQGFVGNNVVESIYWSGKYDASSDKIEFANVTGAPRNWIWFKGCVAQRHVARVMQHVTLLPNFFVDSLEGAYPCAKSKVDPDGKVTTSVPPFRQTSSGVKSP